MELSAVLTLRDKLSAQMNKASKSVSAMTERVNESRNAIAKIAATQNINISARSNISELVSAAQASITSLQNTISQKELALQGKLDFDGLEGETINSRLTELGNYLDKNSGKVEEYNNKLAVLKQKQAEFTDSTKGSVKLNVEQSIESLEKKLADIEAAKQQFAEWQQIRLDYNDLELARAELSTLESAVENLNSTNVAVRAYIDFKTDALKQVYDIDEKLKAIGQKIISPIIKLKDQATEKINNIKEKAKNLAHEKFSPVISAIDKAKSILSSVKTGLAKIAGTVAYPVIKIKDIATKIMNPLKTKLEALGNKIFTPEVRLKAQQVFNTIKKIGVELAQLGTKAGKAVAGATAKLAKGLAVSVGVAATAIGGIGAASINVGSQFEASMSQVAATMGMTADEANYNNEVYAKLANIAKEMGATTKFSASESAEALNYLALAGYDADKACAALPTILNLASAGGMDLATASDMITDSMSALGIAAKEENLTQFGDQMAKAAQKSNTSVEQLGEAILTVGGTASDLAGGTIELNTALGILADSGIKASEGGTHLRNMILSLQTARNSDAAKIFKSMGLSVYDAEGRMRSLGDVFGDLNDQLAGASAEKVNSTLSTIFKQTDLASVRAMLAATADSVESLGSVLDATLADSDTSIAKLGINLEDMVASFDTAITQEQFSAQMLNEFGLSADQAGTLYTGLMSVTKGSSNRWEELSGYITDSNGAMSDMAETMSDNLSGRITEFKSAMEGAGIAIYEALGSSNLKDLVKEASGWIGDLTKATEEGGIDGLVGAIGSVFAKVITKISSMTPQVIEAGISIVSSLISGIKSNLPQMISGITEAGTVFIKGILQLVPELLFAGGELVLQLAEGVIEQLPELLNSGAEAITKLAQGIVDGTPLMADVVVKIITTLSSSIGQNLQPILGAALQVLMALVEGFTQALPVLIPAVVQIITELVKFISQNLNTIIIAALDILMALAQGLIDSIPILIPSIVEIIMNLVQFISDNLPIILEAALSIILALVQGITENIPLLVDGVIQIITGLVTFITENLQMIIEVSIQIIVALVQGLIKALPQLVEGALQLVQVIWDTITNTNWLQLGIDLIKGIGNGLIEGVKAIGETIGGVANSIIDKFKGFLGIHSPSTVMKAEVGFNVGAGVAEGLKETKDMINNEVENLTDDMIVTIGANLSDMSIPEIEFYQPLEPKKPKNCTEPKNFSKGNDIYYGLDIAQPISNSSENNSYSNLKTTENHKQEVKKYYIEKIIENVTITGESDEDRLIQKILTALADDIEETADNMGEEDFG